MRPPFVLILRTRQSRQWLLVWGTVVQLPHVSADLLVFVCTSAICVLWCEMYKPINVSMLAANAAKAIGD